MFGISFTRIQRLEKMLGFLFCFLHANNLEEELRECCFILGSSSKTSDAKNNNKKSCSAALFKMLAVLSGSSGTGFSEVQHFR